MIVPNFWGPFDFGLNLLSVPLLLIICNSLVFADIIHLFYALKSQINGYTGLSCFNWSFCWIYSWNSGSCHFWNCFLVALWKLLDNVARYLPWRCSFYFLMSVNYLFPFIAPHKALLRFNILYNSGLAFALSRERVALFISTVYSLYCAWAYVGWLGLLIALNLAFISSDILIYFLKNNINQQRRPDGSTEQTPGMRGQQGFFNTEQMHASSFETGPGFSVDRGPGAPSTSGTDSEMTSEDEVVRLLNCTDHYSVLGLLRYENVDDSLLKREYRKKVNFILSLFVMFF